MKYLVIISQAHADGTDVPAMTAYDDYNKAVSAFHMELAYSAISDAVASDMAMLADTTGRVYEVTVVQGAAKPAEASTDTSAATGAGTSADTTTTTDTTTTAASTATNQGA
jgi:hypothetical protein